MPSLLVGRGSDRGGFGDFRKAGAHVDDVVIKVVVAVTDDVTGIRVVVTDERVVGATAAMT